MSGRALVLLGKQSVSTFPRVMSRDVPSAGSFSPLGFPEHRLAHPDPPTWRSDPRTDGGIKRQTGEESSQTDNLLKVEAGPWGEALQDRPPRAVEVPRSLRWSDLP